MTWAIFYLVCFLVGVTLSVLSFMGGTWHLPPHMQLRRAARPSSRTTRRSCHATCLRKRARQHVERR